MPQRSLLITISYDVLCLIHIISGIPALHPHCAQVFVFDPLLRLAQFGDLQSLAPCHSFQISSPSIWDFNSENSNAFESSVLHNFRLFSHEFGLLMLLHAADLHVCWIRSAGWRGWCSLETIISCHLWSRTGHSSSLSPIEGQSMYENEEPTPAYGR